MLGVDTRLMLVANITGQKLTEQLPIRHLMLSDLCSRLYGTHPTKNQPESLIDQSSTKERILHLQFELIVVIIRSMLLLLPIFTILKADLTAGCKADRK